MIAALAGLGEALTPRQGCYLPMEKPSDKEHAELALRLEAAIAAHPHFKVREGSTRIGGLANFWRVEVWVRRLGATGMKNRFRKIYADAPSADIAVEALIEGLDHYSESMK